MNRKFTRCLIAALCCLLLFVSHTALAADYYVSAARGKGKKATKEKPAKDIGNIASKLKPGDTVHIAGGKYTGRGDNGTTTIIVPVSVIGGYDDQFETRDPWGDHRTILSGINGSDNWQREPTLFIDLMKYRGKEMPDIVVDGIIVDHGDRNRYKTDKQLAIVRSANPKTHENPTPDQGGLVVRVSKTGDLTGSWNITVQNCIVMNTAPTQGALSVSGHKNTKITIRNNLIINNTGTGILAGTKFAGSGPEGMPEFLIENNTVLFTWKFDPPAQSYSGNTIKFDRGVKPTVRNNVFAFADRVGIHNAVKTMVLLQNNLVLGNVFTDYLEFDTKMDLDELEDEAEFIDEDSEDNDNEKIVVPVSKDWAMQYANRVLIDRNAAEADIKAQESVANDIRSILGLPLQAGTIEGGTIEGGTSPVWLNRISVNDAIACGTEHYNGRGCSKPASK